MIQKMTIAISTMLAMTLFAQAGDETPKIVNSDTIEAISEDAQKIIAADVEKMAKEGNTSEANASEAEDKKSI